MLTCIILFVLRELVRVSRRDSVTRQVTSLVNG